MAGGPAQGNVSRRYIQSHRRVGVCKASSIPSRPPGHHSRVEKNESFFPPDANTPTRRHAPEPTAHLNSNNMPAISGTGHYPHCHENRLSADCRLCLALHPSFAEEAGARQTKIALSEARTFGSRTSTERENEEADQGRRSPHRSDGTKVAFTMAPPGNKDVERYIAVVDVETGATKVFKEMPSDDGLGPVWSPNGSQICPDLRGQPLAARSGKCGRERFPILQNAFQGAGMVIAVLGPGRQIDLLSGSREHLPLWS